MSDIIIGFGYFLPYIFMFCCVGLIWDFVISCFMGKGM